MAKVFFMYASRCAGDSHLEFLLRDPTTNRYRNNYDTDRSISTPAAHLVHIMPVLPRITDDVRCKRIIQVNGKPLTCNMARRVDNRMKKTYEKSNSDTELLNCSSPLKSLEPPQLPVWAEARCLPASKVESSTHKAISISAAYPRLIPWTLSWFYQMLQCSFCARDPWWDSPVAYYTAIRSRFFRFVLSIFNVVYAVVIAEAPSPSIFGECCLLCRCCNWVLHKKKNSDFLLTDCD